MRIKTREAIVGLVVYRVARLAVRRWFTRKGGGIMAGKRKWAVFAGLSAALGALLFWRKKKRPGEV